MRNYRKSIELAGEIRKLWRKNENIVTKWMFICCFEPATSHCSQLCSVSIERCSLKWKLNQFETSKFMKHQKCRWSMFLASKNFWFFRERFLFVSVVSSPKALRLLTFESTLWFGWWQTRRCQFMLLNEQQKQRWQQKTVALKKTACLHHQKKTEHNRHFELYFVSCAGDEVRDAVV